MASLAERTRDAVDRRPFLRTALAAGVLNYAAAARVLDVDGETDAVATALRRYAEDLPEHDTGARSARVTMQSGLAAVDDSGGHATTGDGDGGGADAPDGGGDGPLLRVGGRAFGRAPTGSGESLTAVAATGDVDATALRAVLGRFDAADVAVAAAGVADGTLVVVVERSAGADAVRLVETALDAVPR